MNDVARGPERSAPRPRAPARALARLREAAEGRRVRLALGGLLALSLLPVPGLHAVIAPAAALALATEMVVRATGLLDRRYRPPSAWVFGLADAAALASFAPPAAFEVMGEGGAALASALRLARLVVLARLSQHLGRDLWTILPRREQLQQFGLVTLAVGGLAFTSSVLLGELAVPHDFDGLPGRGEGFGDRMWWAFRQLESADNLVENLRVHPLVAALSLLLTIVGVFIISFLIGLGTNIVGQVVRAERRRPVGFRRHSLVVGPMDQSEGLVREFVRIYDKNRLLRRVRLREVWQWLAGAGPPPRRHALPRMALLGPHDEPPPYLVDPSMRWVVYRQGEGADRAALDLVGVEHAKRVMLVADPSAGEDADAITLASLMAIRDRNRHAHVFVEVLESRNVPLVASVGGEGTFPLDVPRFMGLFLCHHLLAPGVEGVFRGLLTASGAELYTHVFVETEEWATLDAAAAARPTLAFDSLAACAYHRHGVLLAGVFLGGARVGRGPRSLVPVDRLAQWVNPRAVASDLEEVVALGARPGEIPARRLQGLIGIADSYAPLRRYARELAAGRGAAAPVPGGDGVARAAAAAVVEDVRADPRPVTRVLVVGYSPALPSLVRGLARFVPEVEVVALLDAPDGDPTQLAARLAAVAETPSDGAARALGPDGLRVPLERGGALLVHAHLGRDVVGAVETRGTFRAGPPFDAAVFLSEPTARDRDARTLTRVLRFARILDGRGLRLGRRFHVLAEFDSVARGEGLRGHLHGHRGRVRLTLVSTERIQSYFMVHSAFVPGVTALYERLLGSTGAELLRLEVAPGGRRGAVGLWDLAEALGPFGCLPLAVELDGGAVHLAPGPEARFDAAAVHGLYVLGDSDVVPNLFPTPGDSVLPPRTTRPPDLVGPVRPPGRANPGSELT